MAEADSPSAWTNQNSHIKINLLRPTGRSQILFLYFLISPVTDTPTILEAC